MIAYIDESFRDDILSFGVYISRGFDRPLRDFIGNLYSEIWEKYGIGKYLGEAKFHRFIYELGKRGIKLSNTILFRLVERVTQYLGDRGYIIGLAFPRSFSTRDLDPSLYDFLVKIRIRRTTIEKFLPIWLATRNYPIRSIVFDSSFQIPRKDLRRIIHALKLKIETEWKDSISAFGIQVADFIAGITPILKTYNVELLWQANTKIYRFQH